MGELSDGGGYVFIGEAYIDRYYVAAERLHEIQEFHQPEELDAIYRIITFQPTSRCLLDKSILPILQKQKVVLFGAGIVGQSYYRQSFETGLQLEAWIASRPKEGLPVKTLESLDGLEYDVILIAVSEKHTAEEIREILMARGVSHKKILWQPPIWVFGRGADCYFNFEGKEYYNRSQIISKILNMTI